MTQPSTITVERVAVRSELAAPTITKVVAKSSDFEVAHTSVFVDNAIRSTITTPNFADAIDCTKRAIASDRLVAECVEVAREAGGQYIEATPSSQMPLVEDWKAVLANNGFRFVAEKVVLSFSRSAGNTPRKGQFEVISGALVPRAVLLEAYKTCQSKTLDRADMDNLIDLDTNFDELLKGGGENDGAPFLWAVLFDGRPAGVVFLELEETVAWVAYVGVVPGKRQQGVGTSLLCFAVNESWRRGKDVVRSLIDVENQPSIQMFRRCGFVRERGTYYVYRRRL